MRSDPRRGGTTLRPRPCDHAAVAPGGNGRTDVRSGAQSVERALAVLHCFERADRSLGVSELAAATGLTVSTTHRLTRALCAGGLLMQDPRSERYQLGPMVVVLGRRAEEHLGYARALPTLEALAESTGESVNLGIRSAPRSWWCWRCLRRNRSGSTSCRAAGCRSTRRPWASACWCSPHPYRAPTSSAACPGWRGSPTARSPAETGSPPSSERPARGAGRSTTRRNPGVRAVATPVLDAAGSASAAVAVQGPALRLPDDRLPSVARQIAQAGEALGPVLAR